MPDNNYVDKVKWGTTMEPLEHSSSHASRTIWTQCQTSVSSESKESEFSPNGGTVGITGIEGSRDIAVEMSLQTGGKIGAHGDGSPSSANNSWALRDLPNLLGYLFWRELHLSGD